MGHPLRIDVYWNRGSTPRGVLPLESLGGLRWASLDDLARWCEANWTAAVVTPCDWQGPRYYRYRPEWAFVCSGRREHIGAVCSKPAMFYGREVPGY
jgi:hypothetical protein